MRKIDQQLNEIACKNKYVKQFEKWDEVHPKKVLPISVDDFWNNFWKDDARFQVN